MKLTRIYVVLAVFLLVFLAGCGADQGTDETIEEGIDPETGCPLEENTVCGDDGLTYVNSCYSSLRDVGVSYVGACEYEVCAFNEQDHYLLTNMIYYEDDKGRPYIEVMYGTFWLNDNGGWTYKKAINTEVAYYANRLAEYDAGVTESGNEVVCTTTTQAPDNLKEFLKTHGKILELKLEDETTSTDTTISEETSETADEQESESEESTDSQETVDADAEEA